MRVPRDRSGSGLSHQAVALFSRGAGDGRAGRPQHDAPVLEGGLEGGGRRGQARSLVGRRALPRGAALSLGPRRGPRVAHQAAEGAPQPVALFGEVGHHHVALRARDAAGGGEGGLGFGQQASQGSGPLRRSGPKRGQLLGCGATSRLRGGERLEVDVQFVLRQLSGASMAMQLSGRMAGAYGWPSTQGDNQRHHSTVRAIDYRPGGPREGLGHSPGQWLSLVEASGCLLCKRVFPAASHAFMPPSRWDTLVYPAPVRAFPAVSDIRPDMQ